MTIPTQNICAEIVNLLKDKKAENISLIDVSEKSMLTDFLIIVSANSSRQLYATAEHISIFLKSQGILPAIDGTPPCDWVVVDGGSVIIHLFKPEARTYYNLEKMWSFDISNEDITEGK